jgi:peptidylprolyl isomerase
VKWKFWLTAFLGLAMFAAVLGTATKAMAVDPNNVLYLDLKYGRVVIEMRPDLAPHTVARVRELVRSGFYDGLKWHRVIKGFMAQTGDPRGDGTGGSGQKLKAEFSRTHFGRGAVGMARSQDIDSADSQFFICFDDAPWLDGQYTYWGQVTSGMEYVDRLKKGIGSGGMVDDPDIIVRMRVAADVKDEKGDKGSGAEKPAAPEGGE